MGKVYPILRREADPRNTTISIGFGHAYLTKIMPKTYQMQLDHIKNCGYSSRIAGRLSDSLVAPIRQVDSLFKARRRMKNLRQPAGLGELMQGRSLNLTGRRQVKRRRS